MIIALVAGLLVGFILAMPPGPVGVTAIKISLDQGRKESTLLAAGTGLLDFFYCLIAILATGAAVEAIDSFTVDYPFIMVFFQITVIAIFIVFGILNLKKSKKEEDPEKLKQSRKAKFIEYMQTKGPFFLGLAIALTNLANPSFMPSLAYVTMQVHAFNVFDDSAANNLLFSFAFGFGNFLWLFLLSSIVIKYKSKMSTNFIVRVRQFAGVTFISFGTILGYRLITFTKWSEIVRLAFVF